MRFLNNLLLYLMLFYSSSLLSQDLISLKGKIQDSIGGQPLAFAYVTLKGVALGTVTDEEGEFVFNIPSNQKDGIIIFSYLGYQKKEIPIDELRKMNDILIELKMGANRLKEVIIKPRKELTAKKLLKKVFKRIKDNYSQEPVFLEAYYRETISENGACIKFSDASIVSHYDAYQRKPYKWKDFNSSDGARALSSLSIVSYFPGTRLHRIHFDHETIAEDQVKIIDCRSSDNLTKTSMNANIEGGPLSLLGRDRVKYKHSFLGAKMFKKFDYELGEVNMPGKGWVYVISFRTKMTAEELEATSDKSGRRWNKANNNKLLKGRLFIDRDTYAVLKYECSVPDNLKQYFCGYKTMAIKHFDYKLLVEYQKLGKKYHLKRLRHEDEFIFKDTVSNNTIPYNAVSELWVNNVKLDSIYKFKSSENFININANQLYDLPLDYDSLFWERYTTENIIAKIPDSIRKDMEAEKTMEKQFKEKHLRDEDMEAPIAKVVPSKKAIHGLTMVDDYGWLKDTKSPLSNSDIRQYIEAENNFSDNYFIPLRKNQREIFNELSDRLDKENESLPSEKDGYEYTVKYAEESEYPIYLRRKVGEKKQDTLIDVNKMAKGREYYSAGGVNMSPDTRTMAFYENTTGSDRSVLRFKDVNSAGMLNDSLLGVSGMVWIDSTNFIYVEQEPRTNRTYRVKRHLLGTSQEKDTLLYEENDKRFSIGISKSRSKNFIFLISRSTNASEVRFMKMSEPVDFKLIAAREEKHEYYVMDYKEDFYIATNVNSNGFEIMRCPINSYSKKDWKVFLRPNEGAFLTSFTIFDKYWVLGESKDMKDNIRIINKDDKKEHSFEYKNKFAMISVGYNPKFEGDTLQVNVESMTIPNVTINYNMATREKRIVKIQEVKRYFSGFLKQDRVWATAGDGTKIPITLLYRRFGTSKKDAFKRLYLTAYGSYGASSEPGFDHTVMSLINRGFVYAVAHVRGGGELGKEWYEAGKMMNKRNTFTDFIDCAEYLIEEGYVDSGGIVAEGGSAGGLLMGAVANMRPDLFKLIFLDVPFVDVVNTMLDDQLPLTTLEYEEWGNPNNKKYFEYMKSYSPYDNVKAQDYPHMVFTTGINDSRVGYWESAKMVAKLRKLKTNNNLLLLKTNLYAGHGGSSGRYSYYKDLAYKYAIMFDIYKKEFMEELDTSLGND